MVVFLLLFIHFSSAQFFGGNPPSLKRWQIKTDTARIILPVGLDREAQRIVSVVHYLAANHSANSDLSLGNQLHCINIVFQNQTTIANGFVALSPYRSEFLMTPDMNNFDEGSLPWDDQLPVHEYRHAMQFNNFRNGLSKAMYFFIASNISAPVLTHLRGLCISRREFQPIYCPCAKL